MVFDLISVKVAVLLGRASDREQAENSYQFLKRCGATTTYILPKNESLSAEATKTAVPLETADQTYFDALLLFVDREAADSLCASKSAVDLIRSFTDSQKPVGAVSYAVKVLLATGVFGGCRISGEASLRGQAEKLGATWSDKPVAVERYFATAASACARFNEAFARLCSEHKAGSGASLHTD